MSGAQPPPGASPSSPWSPPPSPPHSPPPYAPGPAPPSHAGHPAHFSSPSAPPPPPGWRPGGGGPPPVPSSAPPGAGQPPPYVQPGGAPGPGGAPPGGTERGSLRRAFGGLTTRGRSFLAAGVAAAVCAYALGQADLLRVGVLLAALPLICVLVLHRTRYRVAGSRMLSPSRVPARVEARVRLRVDNISRFRTGLLMLQDQVPYVLGPRPRFMLDRVEAGGHREVSYRVRSDLRGRYALGPLQLRLTDPFGMCELTQSFSAYDTLTVVPPVESLPPVRLSGETSGHGDGRQRSLALAGDDDVIPRGYRHGDDLRRVHWRSTARHGELMVRREEQPQKTQCTVLLDTRRDAYPGSGPDSPFEWAVSGAASVCLHLLERGYAVRLLTDTGVLTPSPESGVGSDSADLPGVLLDTLAELGHSEAPDLAPAYDMLRGAASGGREGLLVAFLGGLDERQVATVARMRHRARRAVAFTTRGSAPVPPGGPAPVEGRPANPAPAADGTAAAAPAATAPGPAADEEAARTLREAGWRVIAGGPGVPLATLWQETDKATEKGLG
ncbi:DUF58 domain-containing protein [Streptomyces sp. AJS327]|uniref:DUF58 domain-containing protein n=1 Tax=Streptomyces sp. AJS327 TaxID=2545265 RepID=UPI0015E0157C|nr:DUF58 domain-containing protein [Streptomyces sp. AJS327]MBA0050321.1 DUF58 domain-containing protein [Streptomyces sp. AJS327]